MTTLNLNYSLSDLVDLNDRNLIIFPTGKPWTLISKVHGIEERLPVPRTGLTQTKLLTAIGKIYNQLDAILPKIRWEDEDGEVGYVPFWGDHQFLEQLDIDHQNQEVILHFGS